MNQGGGGTCLRAFVVAYDIEALGVYSYRPFRRRSMLYLDLSWIIPSEDAQMSGFSQRESTVIIFDHQLPKAKHQNSVGQILTCIPA